MKANRLQLAAIARLIDEGQLRVCRQETSRSRVLCIRHQWEPQPFYDIWSKMGDVEWYATEVTSTEWHIWVRRTPR